MQGNYMRASKYAKLEADYKELRRQYDLLYNAAMEIHSSVSALRTTALAPPHTKDAPEDNGPLQAGETNNDDTKDKEDPTAPPVPYCGMNVTKTPLQLIALYPHT